MKILVMTSSGEPLNSLRPEAELFLGLHRGGDPVTILTGRDSVYWDIWEQAGIRMIDYEPSKRLGWKDVKFLRGLLKSEGFDVAYLLNNPAICNTCFAATGLPVKLVAYRGQTGNIFWYDPSCYLTILHPRLNGISCVSNAVRDDLRRHLGRPHIARTVYKGHDPDWYEVTPADLSEFGIPDGAFVIGCAANNRPRKGVQVLVEAFGKLPADAPVHLLLIGRGMDEGALDEQIRSHPAADRIHRAGFRTDALELVAACGCTVLPALKREGLPKTVIESMVLGVPAVVTDTGGSGELVEDGVSGFVVPPGNAEALADRVLTLHGDPELRARFAEAGKARIRERFHVEDSIRRTREWFQELTGDRDAPHPDH